MSREIDYSVTQELGFKEEYSSDSVFKSQYGYEYMITTKKLTKKISIDWNQTDRTCRVLRISKDGSIMNEFNVDNVQHLRQIVDFFCINNQ